MKRASLLAAEEAKEPALDDVEMHHSPEKAKPEAQIPTAPGIGILQPVRPGEFPDVDVHDCSEDEEDEEELRDEAGEDLLTALQEKDRDEIDEERI